MQLIKVRRLGMVADQLRILMKEHNVTQRKIAEIAGVSAPAVKKWFDGDTKNIATKYSIKIAKYFNVSIEWLTNGVGNRYLSDDKGFMERAEKGHELITIPNNNMNCFCSFINKFGENQEKAITLDYALLKYTGVEPGKTEFIKVDRNNMAPLLFDGEYAIIDTSKSFIEDGKIYALYIFDQIRINRLYRKIDGALILKNENKAFDDDIVPEDRKEIVKVLGKVVARFGCVPFE